MAVRTAFGQGWRGRKGGGVWRGRGGGVYMVYNGDWTKCHCPVHMHAQVVALSVSISVCEHENSILSKLGMLAVFLSTHKHTLLKLTNKSHSKSCEKQDFFAPCANYWTKPRLDYNIFYCSSDDFYSTIHTKHLWNRSDISYQTTNLDFSILIHSRALLAAILCWLVTTQ